MKGFSRRAGFSFVLGFTGIMFALTGASGLLVLAVPLGLASALTGGLAFWSIFNAPATLRGTALALLSTLLGAGVLMFSLFSLAGMAHQQLYREPGRRQMWQEAGQQPETRSPMPDEPITNFTSNLPIIVLETAGQWLSKSEPTVVRARVFNVQTQRASLNAKPDYDAWGTIHLRGSTTLHLPKHSYTFHTMDSQTNEAKVSLLGLPPESDWVLYAPYEDKTLMRDVLAYELANAMGRYAPRTRFFELFVNTSHRSLSMRDYAGLYVLIEKIKRGKDRVNIAKLGTEQKSEPEISGGYIVKRDHSDRASESFSTTHGGPYFYVYPRPAVITSEQKSWLRRYFKAFENALYSENFRDPQRGYAGYLDVGSFIDAHWLIEATKNVDGFRYSAFLSKDRGGKLKPEPPWDWNRSFGNANYYGGGQTSGWYWTNLRAEEISWYLRMREDPDFVERCTARWLQLRTNILDPKRINARVDELAAQLEEAQKRNFKRWPVLGEQITCNYYVGQSYQEEVRWLKNWIVRRVGWIDSQVGKPENP
jgi:hypothetical protein